jgi:hypothetical protein
MRGRMRESAGNPAQGRNRLISSRLGRNLGLGLLFSVAVHLGAGVLLGRESSVSDVLNDSLAEVDQDRAEPLRLGIDHSNAATINWVGFETPTEHSAMKSSVEQAAVTPVLGSARVASEDQPSPASEPQPQETPAEPVTETVSKPVDEPTAETVAEAQETAPVIPMDVFEPMPTVPAFKPDPLFSAKPERKLNPLPTVVPEPKKPNKQPPVKKPTQEVSKPVPPKPRPTTKPVEAAPAKEAVRPADPSGTRGIKDRREADASSKVQALTYRPGRPVAGEGLEIATVRPRFSVTIQVIARPRNPVVRIQFGRDGKVRRAEFVKKKGKTLNTGSVHIDGPLMDAIYRWTAKGVALEPLKKDETLPVEIRLLLNGS